MKPRPEYERVQGYMPVESFGVCKHALKRGGCKKPTQRVLLGNGLCQRDFDKSLRGLPDDDGQEGD